MHYVYLIRCGTRGPIKIGVSKNVKKRLEALQCGNYNKLKIIAEIPCADERDAYILGSKLHSKFYDHRIRGEWFAADIQLSSIRDIELEDEEFFEDELTKEYEAVLA